MQFARETKSERKKGECFDYATISLCIFRISSLYFYFVCSFLLTSIWCYNKIIRIYCIKYPVWCHILYVLCISIGIAFHALPLSLSFSLPYFILDSSNELSRNRCSMYVYECEEDDDDDDEYSWYVDRHSWVRLHTRLSHTHTYTQTFISFNIEICVWKHVFICHRNQLHDALAFLLFSYILVAFPFKSLNYISY